MTMSYLRISIDYDENLLTPVNHRRIMNRLYRNALEHHKKVILPRHFEDVPETRPGGAYGYAKRSEKWKKRKAREGKDPERPLFYKGLMRTIVVRESIVRATYKGGSLTAKNYYDMTTARRHEVEALSNREISRMAGRMKIDYMLLARSDEFRRKRKPKRLAISA